MDAEFDNESAETWDRLVLLLITQPQDGWESEYAEIKWREIERLAVSAACQDCDE
jgi:hypothetical protein